MLSAQAIEVELGSPKDPVSVSPKLETLKGSFGMAWQQQQHAMKCLAIGDNARAVEYFKKTIAAYQESLRRKTEVNASRKGVQDCQERLRQATANSEKQAAAQSSLFRYLEEKAGKAVQMPTFPQDNLR